MNGPLQLSGSLHALSLSGLLQLLGAEGRTGQIDVVAPSATGSLWLESGRVVHASAAAGASPGATAHEGEAALDIMLGLAEGTFAFMPEAKAPARTLTAPTEQLLLESAVRRDHARGGRAGVMEATSIPSFAPVPAGGATPRFTTLQWRVLAAIDGRKDIETLASEVQLPAATLAAMLSELEAAGVIRIT